MLVMGELGTARILELFPGRLAKCPDERYGSESAPSAMSAAI